MGGQRRAAVSLAIGLVAGACAWMLRTAPVHLEPGRGGWTRCVRGAHADGRLGATTVVVLPGIARRAPASLVLEAEGGPANLAVTMDGAPPAWFRVAGRTTLLIPVQGGREPGLRLTLRPDAESPRIRLRSISLDPVHPAAGGAVWFVGLAAALVTATLPWATAPALSLALALVAAGVLALAATPAMVAWSLPAPSALARIFAPLVLVAAGVAAGRRCGARRRFGFATALIVAAVFGSWVRLYFLPSAGSWDVDYWKVCALRTTEHGVTRAYGDPEAVPHGHFLAQMRGEEPQWELPAFGRTFVIDQPPGIMLLWQTSLRVLSRIDHGLTDDEALNVAAKLPAVLGDVLAVFVLVWALGRTRGAALAALYWALPVSWLSSSVLGFFDGAYAPVAVAALVHAGRGRAVWAGGLMALAALVKSTALLVSPAAAIALRTARSPLRRAFAAGAVVVAIALTPFVLDGTLATAVVHMYRILFQQRFSGGYANAWWLLGHFVSLDSRAATDAVPYVRIDTLPSAVARLGTPLFALAAVWIARCQLRGEGPRAAALAGACLVLTYGQLAIGVHENHPHAFVLALMATGLGTRRLRWMAATLFATYVLNMLALSGLGRFYGLRYVALEELVTRVGALRLAAGFDLTVALAVVNLVTFAALLRALPVEMELASAAADGQLDRARPAARAT
jgi:hypothetical protein